MHNVLDLSYLWPNITGFKVIIVSPKQILQHKVKYLKFVAIILKFTQFFQIINAKTYVNMLTYTARSLTYGSPHMNLLLFKEYLSSAEFFFPTNEIFTSRHYFRPIFFGKSIFSVQPTIFSTELFQTEIFFRPNLFPAEICSRFGFPFSLNGHWQIQLYKLMLVI